MALLPLETYETVPGFGAVPRLGPERCRSLLAGALAGHLALSHGALPLVVPATCALDGDNLFVRVGLGWLSRSPLQPGVVAFQTSSTSFDQNWRWEVVVQGLAEVLVPPAVTSPPPLPLIGNELTAVLRIRVQLMTGWQYGTPPKQ